MKQLLDFKDRNKNRFPSNSLLSAIIMHEPSEIIKTI